MNHYLGIDIGTYESRGVLAGADGSIVATAARPHRMLVPQAGWAEHDAEANWWGEFCAISRELIAQAGVAPQAIRAVGASGIGPCMLPVDKDGNPLMNAVLYGVTRDQMMARHRANHIQVAYAPDAETANAALATKVAMMQGLGVTVHLCGTANGLTD